MECGHSFTRHSRLGVSWTDLVNFHALITGKRSQKGLAEACGLGRTTLWSRLLPFFNYVISPSEINALFPVEETATDWVLGLDGRWLHRFGIIMIYRDVTRGVNLWWSWQKSESCQNLTEDFYQAFLLTRKNPPSGIISDWQGSIVAATRAFFPHQPHQRCLAHLVRAGKRLLPAGSPFLFTLKLREIVHEVIFILDPSDRFAWETKLANWQREYGYLLKARTIGLGAEKKWWYTHGNLRRAIRLLTKDQDSLFQFLRYPFLPKTNNSLEGVNSQLKGKLGNHRGMKVTQQVAFCFWYLAFSRIKTREDLRRLWGSLKEKISVV